MSTAAAQPAPAGGSGQGRRLVIAWLLISVILTPIVVIFVGPIMPPGNHSEQASSQVVDNTVLLGVSTPVILLILVVVGYTLVAFRGRGVAADGPPVRGDAGIQIAWVVISTVTVLALAAFGTFEIVASGSGGGEGPSPIFKPSGTKLPVQVIAQQWEFTYRYPTYGGVETPHLVLPANTTIELHVTSLDVIHSFWAYELGVKADANPGVDNVAYVQLKGPTHFHIRCAELCGLWHGYMYDSGRVVPPAEFATWIAQQQTKFGPVAKYLPPYSTSYLPDPQRRAG
jgi:cytochrome c oxidase subunit 2